MEPAPIPGDVQTVADLVMARAAEMGDAEALVCGVHRLSYADVEVASRRWAAAYVRAGLHAGDRVAVSLPNGLPIVLSLLGALRAGVIWVGLNTALTDAERQLLIDDCAAAVVIHDATWADDPDADADDADGDASSLGFAGADPFSPAVIAYTSGTTGTPKGVVHSQRNLVLPGVVGGWRGEGEGTVGTYLPLTSINAHVLGPIYAMVNRQRCVIIDRSDHRTVVAAVATERIVRLTASPTTFHDIVADAAVDPADLASLQSIILGGAPSAERLLDEYEARFGVRPVRAYGLTEVPVTVTRQLANAAGEAGSTGPPLPQFDMEVRNGEIVVRGAAAGPFANVYTPMLGYWNRPEATAALLVEGWLHTGDYGWIDGDGELHVDDRRTDLIVRGGTNVYPAEIEQLLLADGRIRECAVVAATDERLGQVPVAFVRAADPTLIGDDVLDLCRRSLATYKVPVAVFMVDDLPYNSAGKIRRDELRGKADLRREHDMTKTPPARAPYDEFGLFHENAAEYGIPFVPPAVRRVTVPIGDGRSLSALRWGGDESPVTHLFVHGGAQNAHTWDTVLLAMGGVGFLAVDLPGHGYSDAPADSGLSAEANGADLAATMRHLDVGAVHVIGMSLGGVSSIALTAVAPELARSLTLVDITPGVNAAKSQAIAAFVNGPKSFPSFDDLLARTIEHNPTRTEASLRRGILHNALQLDDASWVWRYRRFDAPSPIERADGDASPRFAALWDAVAAYAGPIMLVRGMLTQSVVDDDDEAELLRLAPTARIEHVANAGHSVQGDTPIELAALIADFTAI